MRLLWNHVGEVTARIAPEMLVLIDRAYACDIVSLPYSELKRMVFLSLTAMTQMVIWTTLLEEILHYERYPYLDLIRFFNLILKIKTDIMRLESTAFSERWVSMASLVSVIGASLDFFISLRHNWAVSCGSPHSD